MKLVRVQSDDLQSEIKKRFADFNKGSSPSKGRRYPRELKELVCTAGAQGLEPVTICRLTGLSSSAAKRWLAGGGPASFVPRRLAVVDTRAGSRRLSSAAVVVVRLPSGITIEMSDSRALSADLLAALSSLEVRHAASR